MRRAAAPPARRRAPRSRRARAPAARSRPRRGPARCRPPRPRGSRSRTTRSRRARRRARGSSAPAGSRRRPGGRRRAQRRRRSPTPRRCSRRSGDHRQVAPDAAIRRPAVERRSQPALHVGGPTASHDPVAHVGNEAGRHRRRPRRCARTASATDPHPFHAGGPRHWACRRASGHRPPRSPSRPAIPRAGRATPASPAPPGTSCGFVESQDTSAARSSASRSRRPA